MESMDFLNKIEWITKRPYFPDNPKITKKEHQLTIIGNNEILGWEEIYNKQETRKYTCKCTSLTGMWYFISRENVIDRFKDRSLQG